MKKGQGKLLGVAFIIFAVIVIAILSFLAFNVYNKPVTTGNIINNQQSKCENECDDNENGFCDLGKIYYCRDLNNDSCLEKEYLRDCGTKDFTCQTNLICSSSQRTNFIKLINSRKERFESVIGKPLVVGLIFDEGNNKDCTVLDIYRNLIITSCEDRTQTQQIEQTQQEECTPTTCNKLNYQCGNWDDNCGGIINCGNCNEGYKCVNGKCIQKEYKLECNYNCERGIELIFQSYNSYYNQIYFEVKNANPKGCDMACGIHKGVNVDGSTNVETVQIVSNSLANGNLPLQNMNIASLVCYELYNQDKTLLCDNVIKQVFVPVEK